MKGPSPDTPLWNGFGFTVLNVANIVMWGGYRIFDGKPPLTRTLGALLPAPLALCVITGVLTRDWETAERMALLTYCVASTAQVVYVIAGRVGLFGPRSISGGIVLLNIAAILITTFTGNRWLAGDAGESLFLLTDHLVTIVFTLAVIAMVGERDYRTVLRTAHRDPLTGTLNRSGVADAIGKGASVRTLLLIDFDHFKQINDRFGHDGGDEVLREFAGRMSHIVRPSDLLVRLGGEEFLVATDISSDQHAEALAERIRLAAKEKAVQIGEAAIPFTVSIGLAMRRQQEDLDQAIKRADRALYRAKEAGRDRVSTADLPVPQFEPQSRTGASFHPLPAIDG
ncbi:GGDEF domain-containing protein [Aureimonas sp. AU20]|uniref:GGDEF domain-containing protein n=1 Tax=Aureimonas sp. AU20 TaxID=1349819 RepID=UPI00071FB927|nr:GGDEF domain-containing protein [Aureimonas sp. AU20]ALN75163.1 hypothetical protein M673_20740 [Aureimonas sp. AU20]